MDTLEARLARYRELVDDWPALLEACRRPLPLVVWENPFRRTHAARLCAATGAWPAADAGGAESEAEGGDAGAGVAEPEPLARLLRWRGLQVTPLGWLEGAYRVAGLERPGHTLEHFLGLMHVQEEVSLVPPAVLGARPGERVLDLCAAPGGKTARLAVAMDNRGTLVANDVRPHRLRALRANCERLGALNVVVVRGDGTRFPPAAGPFDRILLDVPCSCEGNLRQSPGSDGRSPAAALTGRSGLQATLLGRAWKLLRPGGTLVYATCTFAPEENEIVLDAVLGEDAEILPLPLRGIRWASGVRQWRGRALRPDCVNVARFWPHLNDTGGFTVALVRRRGGAAGGAVSTAAARPSLAPLPDRELLAWWCRRFGNDAAEFACTALYGGSRNRVWLGAAGLRLHGLEGIEAVGIAFARVSGRAPKPSTAAVQQFGLGAQRRVVELDREQALCFLRRETVCAARADPAEAARGHAIARWRGVPLGCGLWRRGALESQVPKGRALAAPDLPPLSAPAAGAGGRNSRARPAGSPTTGCHRGPRRSDD